MRQVDEAELVWRVKYHLSRLSASLRNGLASSEPRVRRTYEQLVAEVIVRDGLKRLEVLSSAPAAPDADLFTRAAFGGGDGSAPMMAEQD